MSSEKVLMGALEAGRRLAQPEKGEEVVLTGIAGVFPDSDNVMELGEKLFNKVDLISDDDRRWKLGKSTSSTWLYPPRSSVTN